MRMQKAPAHTSLWCGIVGTLSILSPTLAWAQSAHLVGTFSTQGLEGWTEKSFVGHTRYTLTDGPKGQVLMAESAGNASGLYYETEVDLNKTPCLTWSWKVENVLEGLDETQKAGDDFPARVYVVFSTGPFFWQTRAVNYVWSSYRPVGEMWLNPFTEKAAQFAAASGPERIGQWTSHSQNVLEDYTQAFGPYDAKVQAVAVMTDTDDSGRSATAYYGDIRFTDTCS